MASNKNKRREKFMKRLKKAESEKAKKEIVNVLPIEEKENNKTELQEKASEIAARILVKELQGRIGKKDIEER